MSPSNASPAPPEGDRPRATARRRPRWLVPVLVVSGLLVALMGAMRVEAVQDGAVERLAQARIYGTVGELLAEDGLHVIVCGSGSPLPNPERAQACVVVFAGDRGYVFDVGAGSAGNMGQWRIGVYKALQDAGISTPFPQRDLHLTTIEPGAAEALATRATLSPG